MTTITKPNRQDNVLPIMLFTIIVIVGYNAFCIIMTGISDSYPSSKLTISTDKTDDDDGVHCFITHTRSVFKQTLLFLQSGEPARK